MHSGSYFGEQRSVDATFRIKAGEALGNSLGTDVGDALGLVVGVALGIDVGEALGLFVKYVIMAMQGLMMVMHLHLFNYGNAGINEGTHWYWTG